MASLVRIPARIQRLLIEIGDLKPESFAELLALVQRAAGTVESKERGVELARSLKTIAPDKGALFLEALLPLYFLKNNTTKPVAEVVRDVCFTISVNPDIDPKPAPECVDRLTARLVSLLSVDSIDEALRARTLSWEAQNVFSTARILTDIRPVFNHDLSTDPRGAIIVHSLKLTYTENGERKAMFFALDSKDVSELGQVLERARDKETVLRKFLSSTSLHGIDLPSED